MNIIEKRKGQLKWLGLALIIIGLLAVAGGIVMLVFSVAEKIKVVMLVCGILLIIFGIVGGLIGIPFVWTASAIKATNGSIAEDNLGKGTVNMHKCENCGAEIEDGKTICAKCEENLR